MNLIYNTVYDSSSVSFSDEATNFPGENTQQIHLSNIWRTPDGVTSATIEVDTQTTPNVSVFVLDGHNLTDSATITLEGNSTNTWLSPLFSSTVSASPGPVLLYTDTKDSNTTTPETHRYWRITITDGTNPDTYLSVGRIYLGDFLTCPAHSRTPELSLVGQSSRSFSVTGQIYGDLLPDYKTWKTQHNDISDSERRSLSDFYNSVSTVWPFWVDIYPENNWQAFYAILLSNDLVNTITSSAGIHFDVELSFREVF